MKDFLEALNRRATLRGLDLSRFSHPLALQIDWTPLIGGGANFKTRQLRRIGPQRIEFKYSTSYLLGWGFFIAAAAVIAVLMLPGMPLHLSSESALVSTLPILSAGIFIVCGSLALRLGAPLVFDRAEGYFWSGRRKGDRLPASHCPLRTIVALQILREHLSETDSAGHDSYELNLVLENGHRLNVLDHGSLPDIRFAATELQSFLPTNPPIWDATTLIEST